MSTVPGHDQDSRTGPTNQRIGDPTERGRLVHFTFNGRTIDAYEGETIAAAGAAVVEPGRIALNPDCGVAPDYEEPPSIDEAYEKLCNLTQVSSCLREQFAE